MGKRRVWRDKYGNVNLRTDDGCGNEIIRSFFVRDRGEGYGYVYEHPRVEGRGLLPSQVCEGLGNGGSTLESSETGLLSLIRDEYDRQRRRAAREFRPSW